MVVKEVVMSVRREVDVEASPEDVWEALATEEGRERWLEEPGREIEVEDLDAPHRLVWRWAEGDGPPSRVEFEVHATPDGARVVVTETAPRFPLAMLAAGFDLVLA
ncbi:MAG TPA: SRPBCC domain-containing protein [Solirubrobacteraceae bacterium]